MGVRRSAESEAVTMNAWLQDYYYRHQRQGKWWYQGFWMQSGGFFKKSLAPNCTYTYLSEASWGGQSVPTCSVHMHLTLPNPLCVRQHVGTNGSRGNDSVAPSSEVGRTCTPTSLRSCRGFQDYVCTDVVHSSSASEWRSDQDCCPPATASETGLLPCGDGCVPGVVCMGMVIRVVHR